MTPSPSPSPSHKSRFLELASEKDNNRHHHYHHDSNDDAADLAFSKRSGCCFWVPFVGSSEGSTSNTGSTSCWDRIRGTEGGRGGGGGGSASIEGGGEPPWWARGWHKLREWSELVAGPRWKTFIRRFNKNRFARNSQFRYDPLSYALNFDEGQSFRVDEDNLRRDFSSRYASFPSGCRSSMDLSYGGPIST